MVRASNETAIGVGLYHRDANYDTKLDSIVRTQAKRLRERLFEYYGNEGAWETVMIKMARTATVLLSRGEPLQTPAAA